MGEPALNPEVLDVIEELPDLYDAPGLMPSLSTIAPFGTDQFFNRLLEIKNKHYSGGNFQFQFSIHTTDESRRREIVPVKTWDFEKMSAYGERFCEEGDRKVTLNFALAAGMPVDASVLHSYFSPDKLLIKITPIHPTYKALDSGLSSYVEISKDKSDYKVVRDLEAFGYQVILSIGEVEENLIGSNCGQFVIRHISRPREIADGYTYKVERDEILNI